MQSVQAHHLSGNQPRPNRSEAEEAVRTLLRWIGDDPQREGLCKTAERVVQAYEEMFSGYHADARALLSNSFEEIGGYQDIVVLRNIRVLSHCEHHMLPIIGQACVAYLPDHRVVGISKLARLVDAHARKLQIQEKLTADIATTINDILAPKGVGVVIKACHSCMTLRGVREPHVDMVTRHLMGAFTTDPVLKKEALSLLEGSR